MNQPKHFSLAIVLVHIFCGNVGFANEGLSQSGSGIAKSQGAKAQGADSQSTSVDGSAPSWMRGVSTYNGSGYDLTSKSSPVVTTGAIRSNPNVPAYTVPVDPNATMRLNPFASGPPMVRPVSAEGDVLPLPFIGPTNFSGGNPPASRPPVGETIGSGAVNQLVGPTAPEILPLGSPAPDTVKLLDGIETDVTDDIPPLQNVVTRWYQYPLVWMKGWNSNAEFGINGSSGNASTLALQTGLELKRKTDLYTFAIDTDYRQASSRNVTTEDNGRVNIDYDRVLANKSWSAFGKLGLEWDEFKSFDLRINTNAGLAYNWIRTDDTTFITRFGAGASKEIGSPDDNWTPEAVFGIDAERQLTERQKVKAKIDYFPAWEDFSNYRIVADASWEILLDGSDNLSLKLSATDRYDSTPQGAKPNDVYYSLLLLYKF